MGKLARDTNTLEVLRPYRHLFTRGVVAVIILTVPLFAVFYWLTIPTGEWSSVLLIQCGFLILTAAAIVAYFTTTIRLCTQGVRERGFFGNVIQVHKKDAHAILLVEVFETHTLETRQQLFVTDMAGRLLLRMRGQFWSLRSMERLAEHLEAPINRPAGPVTFAELRRNSPFLLYWFERFPRVRRPKS